MRILFLVPYPLREAPSQRFRFEQYFHLLVNRGYTVRTQSFLSSNQWQLFYKNGNQVLKAFALIRGYVKRCYALIMAPSFDFVFIHREAAPLGPPAFEWILARIIRKRIIYDFDDAIWLTDRVREPALQKILKWRQKVRAICRWSYKVSCGNEYLRGFALRFNPNAICNPTTIDCEKINSVESLTNHQPTDTLIIGWTGSHSTLKYLCLIEPVLQEIEKQFPQVSFLVIADQAPTLRLSRTTFVKWDAVTEVTDLMKIDIGIMPLPDDEWTKGKCGFKALQYMSLGIPAVASPVGVNKIIINHGVNGFLCHTETEWLVCLKQLITDGNLRHHTGMEGRKKVISNYSVSSNASNFLGLFS